MGIGWCVILLLSPSTPTLNALFAMADEDTPLKGQVPVDAHPDDGPATVADGALEAPATGVNPPNNLPTEGKDAIPNTTQK